MTKFGKVLVFLNLTLSLVFATWALGVWTQRVDWTDKKKDAADERTWGKVAVYREEMNRLNGTGDKPGPRGLAELRWLGAVADVRAVEKERSRRQEWYADQINALENGTTVKGVAVNEPIKRPVYVKGELQLEKDGLPKLEVVPDRAGKPLQARTRLEQDKDALAAEIAKVQGEIKALTMESDRLTERVRQLFVEIERTARTRQGSQEEQRYLEQIMYNVRVEAELLLDRQKELEARLSELKAIGAKAENR